MKPSTTAPSRRDHGDEDFSVPTAASRLSPRRASSGNCVSTGRTFVAALVSTGIRKTGDMSSFHRRGRPPEIPAPMFWSCICVSRETASCNGLFRRSPISTVSNWFVFSRQWGSGLGLCSWTALPTCRAELRSALLWCLLISPGRRWKDSDLIPLPYQSDFTM